MIGLIALWACVFVWPSRKEKQGIVYMFVFKYSIELKPRFIFNNVNQHKKQEKTRDNQNENRILKVQQD